MTPGAAQVGEAFEVTVRSVVAAPRDRVWARVSTMPGVNYELWPIFRMTYPSDLWKLDEELMPMLGRRAFRSWVLLFGVLPVDYDDLTLVRVEPGHGFLESSTMLTQRAWRHERTLEDDPAGCAVTDRVRFEPRMPVGGRLVRAVVGAVFRHRHRRLRRAFGHPAA